MLHLALEGANIAAMQGLQPYLQASGSQGLPNNLLRPHPSLQGEIALQSSFRDIASISSYPLLCLLESGPCKT